MFIIVVSKDFVLMLIFAFENVSNAIATYSTQFIWRQTECLYTPRAVFQYYSIMFISPHIIAEAFDNKKAFVS